VEHSRDETQRLWQTRQYLTRDAAAAQVLSNLGSLRERLRLADIMALGTAHAFDERKLLLARPDLACTLRLLPSGKRALAIFGEAQELLAPVKGESVIFLAERAVHEFEHIAARHVGFVEPDATLGATRRDHRRQADRESRMHLARFPFDFGCQSLDHPLTIGREKLFYGCVVGAHRVSSSLGSARTLDGT
jgi:hypothetical protein